MILIPSIDLLDGRCVRLQKGAFDTVTSYTSSQEELIQLAESYENDGAKRLHLVDLNGTLTGKLQVGDTLHKLRSALNIPIQVGGGIRSFEQAEALIRSGFNIVIGTLLFSDPEAAAKLFNRYPNQIVAALDCKPILDPLQQHPLTNTSQATDVSAAIGGLVSINGWTQQTTRYASDLLQELELMGCLTALYTDISRDGMLTGPATQTLDAIISRTKIQIIASGGIRSIEDLQGLKQLKCSGAIVGRALYEKAFSLKEALQKLADEPSLLRSDGGALC